MASSAKNEAFGKTGGEFNAWTARAKAAKADTQWSVDAPAFVPSWQMTGTADYYAAADVAQDMSYCAFNMEKYGDENDEPQTYDQEETFEQVRYHAAGGQYDYDEVAAAASVCMFNFDGYSDGSDSEAETAQKPQPQLQQVKAKTVAVPSSPSSREASSPTQEPLAEPSPTGASPVDPQRDMDEPSRDDGKTKSDVKPEVKDPHAKLFGGRVPPWRCAASWAAGKDGLAAAKKAAAAEVATEVASSRLSGAWPSLGTSSGAQQRLPPWRRGKIAQAAPAADDSAVAAAEKQVAEPSSSSSTSLPVVPPQARELDRLSSEASSEPEAEASERDAGSEDGSAIPAVKVMGVLELLLWGRSAGFADLGAEGFKYSAVATAELADLLPAPEVETKPTPSTPSRRASGAKDRQVDKRPSRESTTMEKRPMREVAGMRLQVSENSWAAKQKARRGSAQEKESDDEVVVRTIKSLLNKLTVEKFVPLYHQLLDCGITTTKHVEILIQEVFEKATTQHHFIDMYADLCTLVHEHFVESPVGDDPKFSFKRLLLNECQASFERHLTPPTGLAEMDHEERTEAEVRYKTKMLGNIKLVGALLARKMLASKVMLAILEELLGDPTPEALESLAALLSAVGPTFDTPEWAHQPALNAIFMQVRTIAAKPTCEPRARCLLKDVLDLRAAGWKDRKPKRMEGPTTLGQVAKIADAEAWAGAAAITPITLDDRRAAVVARGPSPKAAQCLSVAKKVQFNEAAFREEVAKVLAELRVSHDVDDAVARIASQTAPPQGQLSQEVCKILSEVAQEGRLEARKAGFEMVAGLFREKAADGWQPEALSDALQLFADEVCPDLVCDVPNLPRILREELKPALAALIQRGLLKASQLESGLFA